MYDNSQYKKTLEILYLFDKLTSDFSKKSLQLKEQRNLSLNANELLSLIDNIIEVFRTHIELKFKPECFENREDTEKLKDLSVRFSSLLKIYAQLYPYFRFVVSLDSDTNNWSIFNQFSFISKKLRSDVCILSVPDSEYNFKYTPIFIELYRIVSQIKTFHAPLSNAIHEILVTNPNYFSLSFPLNTNIDVLNLTLWGHEIGHLIDNIIGLQGCSFFDPGYKLHFGTNMFYRSVQLSNDFIERKRIRIYKKVDVFKDLFNIYTFKERRPEELIEPVIRKIAFFLPNWAKELFSDMVSVIVLGPAALLNLEEFSPFLNMKYETERGIFIKHPPSELRYYSMMFTLEHDNNNANFMSFIDSCPNYIKEHIIHIQTEVKDFEKQLEEYQRNPEGFNRDIWGHFELILIIKEIIEEFLFEILDFFKKSDFHVINSEDFSQNKINNCHTALDNNRPIPLDLLPNDTEKVLPFILNIGWMYWLKVKGELHIENLEFHFLERINKLLLKTFENYEVSKWFKKRRDFGMNKNENNVFEEEKDTALFAGTLSASLINARLDEKDNDKKLSIEPILDVFTQLNDCAFDVRLGNKFSYTKASLLTELNPSNSIDPFSLNQFQEEMYVPLGRAFILHPGQFALGTTLEFINMPKDLFGLLLGRSSYCRLGLHISTPIKIRPSYIGCVVIQLSNLGNVPLLLYPCSRIGQILFFNTT